MKYFNVAWKFHDLSVNQIYNININAQICRYLIAKFAIRPFSRQLYICEILSLNLFVGKYMTKVATLFYFVVCSIVINDEKVNFLIFILDCAATFWNGNHILQYKLFKSEVVWELSVCVRTMKIVFSFS